MAEQEGPEDLVPIRLRLLLGETHIVDTFLWDKRHGAPEMLGFSQGFCRDLGVPVHLAPAVVKEMKRQVEAWEGGRAEPSRGQRSVERLEVIRLDFAVGVTRFTDQLIWDVNDPRASPERFAAQLAADLGLDGAIAVEVACKLREQLAQLRRQTHKRSSAALLGGIEEPAHKLRSSSRRPAAQAAAQQAGGGATSAGGQPLQSTHQSRWVRPPELREEWGPEVRMMSSQEALVYSMEAAQRAATEAEAMAAAAAKASVAAEAEQAQAEAAAQMSPRSTGPDGDLPSARQLRPRRTARLTELMAAMESPCGGGVPTTSQGAAGGAGGGMTKRSSGGQQGGGGGGGLAAAVSGGAGGLPITGPALEAGLAATLSGNPPQLPRQLSTRQQQMLLHRRQLLMQDAAAVNGSGGALVQDREPSTTLSAGFSALLRHQQQQPEAGLLGSQPQPSSLLGGLPASPRLVLPQQPPPQQQQLPGLLPGMLDPAAGGPGQQQLPGQQNGMSALLGRAGGGPLLPMVPTSGAGGDGLGGPLLPPQGPLLMGERAAAVGNGLPRKKSPYANLFGEMFEDVPPSAGGGGGGGLGLEPPGSNQGFSLPDLPSGSGLLLSGPMGSSALMGARGSAGGGNNGAQMGLALPSLEGGGGSGGGGGTQPLHHVPGSEVDLLTNINPPPAMFF